VHTVLVDMRARLARSDRPNRIFEVTLQAAKAAGLVGRKWVLDCAPLYDAVATMDTVTLIRSAIRGLLQVAGDELEAKLRARLSRDDDYARAGKPVCDYDDPAAREELVDALARDAYALLACLDEQTLESGLDKAAKLLATVVGQDLDQDGSEGMFSIARRVAADRVISTVDPDARHGHKTSARGFDGYKGHIAIDPDAQLITATEVTAGDAGDAEPATDLLTDDLPTPPTGDTNDIGGDCGDCQGDSNPSAGAGTTAAAGAAGHAHGDGDEDGEGSAPAVRGAQDQQGPAVYGDAAYGTGKLLAVLETAGAQIFTKVQPPTAPGGRYAKDRFSIDLHAGTVTCPNAVTVPIRPATAWWHRGVRSGLRLLPNGRPVHRRGRWAHRRDQSL
jgi:hypothetical protein